MGNDVTPDNIRGFLQPIRITKNHIWAEESTYTEKNPIAGMPSPAGNYNLVLSSVGEQNDNADITITTKRSGSVGKQTGATFTWRSTDTSDEHGHEIGALSGYEAIQSEGTNTLYSNPQSATNDAGDIFVTFVSYSVLTLKYSVKFAHRSHGEGTWTISTIGSSLSIDPRPAICMTDDNTILIVHWTKPETDKANISSLRSTDKGVSWQILSDNGLFDDISTKTTSPYGYVLGRLSMSSTVDNVLIMAALTSTDAAVTFNLMGQFASNNRGGSFVAVGITDTTTVARDRSSASVTTFNGQFYISYIKDNDSVVFFKVPNPYYDMTNLDGNLDEFTIINDVTVGTSTPTVGENVLFCDDDGTFYNLNQNISGSRTFTNSIFMTTSRQDGQSWQSLNNRGVSSFTGLDPDPIFNMSNSNILLDQMSACISQGRIALVSSFQGNTSINSSIVVHYFGGYTTRTQGPMREFAKYTDLAGYIVTWTPLEKPDISSEFTTTGAGTASLSLDKLNIVDQKYYTSSRTTTTPSEGYSIRMSLKQNTAGLQSEVLKMTTTNGSSDSYSASIRISQTTLVIYDNVAGASVGSVSVDSSTGIEFLVSMRNDKVYVWYQRFKGASYNVINEYKTWTLLESTALQDDNHTTVTTNELSWGILQSATQDIDFFEFAFSLESYTGQSLNDTTELLGRSYSFTGAYTYINGGLRITTKDGPAFAGDSYNVVKSAEYPIDRSLITISKSPRVAWRSIPYTGTSGGNMRIAFYLDPTLKATVNSDIGNDLVGLYLGNINFHKFKMQYYNISTSAWVDYDTINTYEGMTFNYTRRGNTIIYSSNIDDFYLYHGEAIGWTILLEDSLGDFHAVEIEHNTEGSFVGAAYDRAKRPTIFLKGAVSTLPTAGEARIVPNNVTISMNLLGVNAPAWAIQILDSPTISGDYVIGSFAFGPIVIQAPQYARGRTISLEPQTNILETQDNNIYTQNISDSKRVLRVSWSTGISTHAYYGTASLEPDYYVSSTQSGALPVASLDDVPYQLEGLYRYLKGADLPIVYLPKIVKDTGSNKVQVHNRRESHIYGVTVGDLAIESMLGNEMLDEVLRVSTITIQEVI